ncbi:MAG: hypothetical protein IPF60_16120 [Betaproteobacteria bacterium]|nr:hypothetical protein [Betaproteobacteria bacterium]
MKTKLTKAVCEATPFSRGTPTVIHDSIIGGFSLKVGKTAKTFCFQRDVKVGEKRKTLRHPSGATPATGAG